ncbi:hypothetical protein O3I_012270 [Nocardia brasiliensis ATCC 700358]|uniref:Uncharacterized protein n=1 Tax=Nocardia brasiliensis (strain ATCC 700358 / HUJEG-1) TaxID=1133849 RepID=K0EU62_NOCB7|nr:hypothetical protein O3I_012270 [Nocardia brasiliensis ATCC 700358]
MDAARSALVTCASGRTGLLTAGDRRIPMHGPILRSDGPYLELSVLPVGVGHGVALDGSIPGVALTAAELGPNPAGTDAGRWIERIVIDRNTTERTKCDS